MKPTQRRAEEGEMPEKVWVWLFRDQHGVPHCAAYMAKPRDDLKPVPYVPASRVTALELELERAKGWLRNALRAVESETRPGGGLSNPGRILQSALRDLGEGQ